MVMIPNFEDYLKLKKFFVWFDDCFNEHGFLNEPKSAPSFQELYVQYISFCTLIKPREAPTHVLTYRKFTVIMKSYLKYHSNFLIIKEGRS